MIKLFILIFGLFFWTCEDETKELIIDDLWGQEINNPPEYYKAADVPNSEVDQVIEYNKIASTAWGNYGPPNTDSGNVIWSLKK